MLRQKLLLIAVAVFLVLLAQGSGAERKIPQTGVKEAQVPFQTLKPSATFKIGKTVLGKLPESGTMHTRTRTA